MLLDIKDIHIAENRQRRKFSPEALEELAQSILSKGLLHAPVVRRTDTGYSLVAGERRLRAMLNLAESSQGFVYASEAVPPGKVPVTLLSDLSPIEVEEAELEENVVREDLTWDEKVAAYARLEKLRGKQAEAEGLPPPTVQSIASEVLGRPAKGDSITRMATALRLADHLDDPEVAKAKSQKEAEKILRKRSEEQHRAMLAQTFNKAESPHTLLLGDFREMNFSSGMFDHFIIDPPYGVGADQFSDQATTSHDYKDDWPHARDVYQALASTLMTASKPHSGGFIFCDITRFYDVRNIFELHGWDCWSKPIIWEKNLGMLPEPERGPRLCYETALLVRRTDFRIRKSAPRDILSHPLERERKHGAQKPVGLYVELLSWLALPGDTVADLCCGSGTIFPAATLMNCRAFGVEIVKENHDIAVLRLNEKPTLEL